MVDTWKDIKEVLAKQIALVASNESSSTSTAADAEQQGESRDVNDMTGFELSDAEGVPSGNFFLDFFFWLLMALRALCAVPDREMEREREREREVERERWRESSHQHTRARKQPTT